MRSDLRRNPQRSMGRYWLTMSDASAFTIVKSAFGIADALRRDLADQAQMVALLDVPALAVLLLTAAETGWGKAKAPALMGQIGDARRLGAAARSQAWGLLRVAMESLPTTLWPAEKLLTRRELLDELQRHAQSARSELPTLLSKAERQELQWRESIMARVAAEKQMARGGRP